MIALLEGDVGPVSLRWALVISGVLLICVFGGLNAIVNRKYVFEDGMVHGVVGRMGSGKSLFVVQRVLLPFCRRLSKRGVVYSVNTERPVRRVITNFKFDPRMPNVEVLHVSPTATTNIFEELILLSEQIGEREGPWLDADGVLQDGRKEPPAGVRREPILNALVILDEMHFFMESSKIAMDKAAGYAISMARKWNCEMWWVSQHEMKVHKRLRDESSMLWLCGKVTAPASWVLGERWHLSRQYSSAALVEKARQAGSGGKDAPRSTERRFYRYTKTVGRVYNSFELLVPNPARGFDVAARTIERRNALALVPSSEGDSEQPAAAEDAASA